MEKIVYSNMIDLLLEYGNKTESEIIDSAIERFGFPRLELEHNIMPLLAFKKNAGYIEKCMRLAKKAFQENMNLTKDFTFWT